jgi:branched-chain amino acid transport system ATP-binding protein
MRLEVRNLDMRYGCVQAVRGVSLTVEPGEIVAVLGANGAGKSSLLKAVLGMERPVSGAVLLDGEDVTRLPPSLRIRRGLIMVPEGRRIVMSLTIHDNLLMGAFARSDRGRLDDEIAEIYRRFPNLAERRSQMASVLSGGEQQMLAIGRGLLAGPKIMMLDEPSLGLSPRLTTEVFALIGALNRDRGIAMLLVEQNTRRALALASRAYVLELGRLALEGTPKQLLSHPALREAYLGRAGRKRSGLVNAKGSIRAGRTDRHWKGSIAMKVKLSGLLTATALVMSGFSASAQDILLGYLPALAWISQTPSVYGAV